jgi:E3 ubiquitin-protein ligase UBR3
MFASSVARTNLELDLVWRGGVLITAPGAAAASSLVSARPSRSCFLPLLHVLAIHMKVRLTRPLVADWCQVSGLWQDEDERSLLVRETEVPMLLRDTAALLLHFTLVLPVQIDQVFFTCLVRQLYNLAWLQAALKLACRLPVQARHRLRDDWNLRVHQAESQAYTKVDTVALGIGLVSAALDATGVFNDDVDYPREKGRREGLALSLEELEAAVQAECLCFMRVAALLRHYVYSEPLPEIWEPDWEFTRLAQFLGMADNDISGRVSSGPCLGWLTAPAVLSYRWCRELGGLVARSHLSARRLVLVNSMWRQPQLLRLPRNYDSIFQVRQKSYCSCFTVLS